MKSSGNMRSLTNKGVDSVTSQHLCIPSLQLKLVSTVAHHNTVVVGYKGE